MRRKRILLDVDGILADFVSAAVDVMHGLTGKRFPLEAFTTWDVTSVLEDQSHRDECNAAFARPGFASAIKPYAGAAEAVTDLRLTSDVLFVTTPHPESETWAYERTRWLIRHFGASHAEVIHAHRKHAVAGDLFLDDKPANVRDWGEHNPGKHALLWDMPYNRDEGGLVRVSGWAEVLQLAR